MNNKRIALAINYNYPDYGGMLQAYALFRTIKKLGYSPEAINIGAISNDIKFRKIMYFIMNFHDFSVVSEKSQVVLKKIIKIFNRELYLNLEKRYSAFVKFYKEKFVVSEKYNNWSSLSSACRKYSAVIVGSDQLWLPSNIAGDFYTLAFVPDDVKKISYATSFGVSKMPKKQKKKVSRFLNRIDFISAREETGKEIIKEHTGKDVPLVCDPALLLSVEEWNQECSKGKIIKDRYIFCYFMGNNPWQRDFVKKLKTITGFKIVSLLHLDQYIKYDEFYADETPYNISPADFINLVKNAEYICTDSFHGTLFSSIYKKKFFTFIRFSEKATLSTNSRIFTLLRKIGAEDRLVLENYNIENLVNSDINYDVVNSNIIRFRNESLEYLENALES